MWLIEQRPSRGRWASLWQFVTTEATASPVTAAAVRRAVSVKVGTPRRIGTVEHALTHRKYRFEVYLCDFRGTPPPQLPANRRWVRFTDLAAYPLPRPHLRIAQMLKAVAPI